MEPFTLYRALMITDASPFPMQLLVNTDAPYPYRPQDSDCGGTLGCLLGPGVEVSSFSNAALSWVCELAVKTVPGSHLVLPPSVHISPQERGELIVEQSKSHPESDTYVIGM